MKSEVAPLSVLVPGSWEAFADGKLGSYEVLLLQSPEKAEYDSTLSFELYPLDGAWEDVVRRQNYHLLVWEGAPLSTNQALALRGAKGHKWIYKLRGEDGTLEVHYRLYLLLPKTLGEHRLLVLQGLAPAENSLEILPLFNRVVRSLAWGLQATNAVGSE